MKDSILDTVGNTPLVRLDRIAAGVPATVCGKLEQFNPLTSIKDRPALAMVEAGERAGLLRPGSVIVEPTSGNTGLGLAMVGAVKGYRVILVVEAIDRLGVFVQAATALGAEVITTSSFERAVALARQFAKDDPRVFMPNQFENPANPACHERTTAQEILHDAGPRLRAFVGSFGSGGTLTGVSHALKAALPAVKIVLAEPDTVPLFSGGPVTCSMIHGVGPTFRPPVMADAIIDEIIPVSADEAHDTMRDLARKEGILVGPSSGALVAVAVRVARTLEPGDIVVTVLPDFGMRYLGLGMFARPEVRPPRGSAVTAMAAASVRE
jgi:cysteine synthase A